MYNPYIIIIIIFLSHCNSIKKDVPIVQEKIEIKKEKSKQDILNKRIDVQNIDEITLFEEECPCKMPKIEDRYGVLIYEGSLVDGQEKLVIKLCENEKGLYAISVESWNDWGEESFPKRGKIYDYKTLKIEEENVDFGEVCTLQENGEYLYRIFTSKGIHSVWRIKKGKLIEMDKNKEYDCIEEADMG